MKKIFFIFLATVVPYMFAYAQVDSLETIIAQYREREAKLIAREKERKIFGNNLHLQVGYSWQTLRKDGSKALKPDNETYFKSRTGIFLDFTGTIKLHRRPLGSMVRIGLDLGLDVNYSQYVKGFRPSDRQIIEYWYTTFDQETQQGILLPSELGVFQTDIACVVGPRLDIAPFVNVSSKAAPLRFYANFDILPGFSAVVCKHQGKMFLNRTMSALFKVGFGIQYKYISIGYDYRFGNSYYNKLDENSLTDWLETLITRPIEEIATFRLPEERFFLSNHRLVISFNF